MIHSLMPEANLQDQTLFHSVMGWTVSLEKLCWNPSPITPPLLLFSHVLMFNSLQPPGLQHARLPCPSLSLGVGAIISENMTLFEDTAVTVLICKWRYTWVGWVCNPKCWPPTSRQKLRYRQRRKIATWWLRQRLELCYPRNVQGYQKLEEVRKDHFLNSPEALWLCQPWFWTSYSQNCKTILFQATPSVLLKQLQETNRVL